MDGCKLRLHRLIGARGSHCGSRCLAVLEHVWVDIKAVLLAVGEEGGGGTVNWGKGGSRTYAAQLR